MSENLKERNAKYLEYLVGIGVIDDEQCEALYQKCGEHEERQVLFEISNIFADFTASDWFDLSCRIYSNWEKLPTSAEGAVGPYQNKEQNSNALENKDEDTPKVKEESPKPRVTVEQNEEVIHIYGYKSAINSREASHKQPLSNKTVVNNITKKNLDKFCNVLLKYTNKAYLSNLKSHFNYLKLVLSFDAENSQRNKKAPLSYEQNEKSQRSQTDKDWHSKLYYDHFQRQVQLEIQRETKKASERENCTFAPQVNPINNENAVLANTLRVPVYERLLQAKPAPTNAMLEKYEYRELKGATFKPDISKSQKRNKGQDDFKNTPEEKMKGVTERLYEDAQIKEKLLWLRQMNQKEQEIEGCTFSPQVLSPKKDKENFGKNDLTQSVDRLYEENMRRQRKLLKKEAEIREQEFEECTFQPDRLAKNYKSKNESDLDDLDAHGRLYERFKRKQERNSYFTQETGDTRSREASQRRDNSRYRSNSVLEEKTPKKSPKEFTARESVNTPAFDRLYQGMSKKKLKLNQLKERVNKEEGITFHPQTNWSKKSSRSISAANRSQQEIRFSARHESKYTEGEYVQEPISQHRQTSDKLIYKYYG